MGVSASKPKLLDDVLVEVEASPATVAELELVAPCSGTQLTVGQVYVSR